MGSGVDTVMVDDGRGGATYSTPLDALGQQAFVNRGAEAAPKPIILVDPATQQQVGGFAVGGQYVLSDHGLRRRYGHGRRRPGRRDVQHAPRRSRATGVRVQLNELTVESLNVTAASIAQNGTLTVQQGTSLNASAVQLADVSNDFGGNVELGNVGTAELADEGELSLCS